MNITSADSTFYGKSIMAIKKLHMKSVTDTPSAIAFQITVVDLILKVFLYWTPRCTTGQVLVAQLIRRALCFVLLSCIATAAYAEGLPPTTGVPGNSGTPAGWIHGNGSCDVSTANGWAVRVPDYPYYLTYGVAGRAPLPPSGDTTWISCFNPEGETMYTTFTVSSPGEIKVAIGGFTSGRFPDTGTPPTFAANASNLALDGTPLPPAVIPWDGQWHTITIPIPSAGTHTLLFAPTGNQSITNFSVGANSFVGTPAVSLTKTVSASPLLVGAPNQFYDINVTVAGTTTTAPLSLNDTLPRGITLSGTPTITSGTATLSACPATGNNISGCSVAAGVGPGNFSIRIPITIAVSALGENGGTNTVQASGGGDPACTATGKCAATIIVPVLGPVISTTKTVSANPLLVGAQTQFYDIHVTVTNAATFEPLLINDTLPRGITLRGMPTITSGTATLSACPASGDDTTGCTIASGVMPGTFTVRIPVAVAASAVADNGASNTVNMSGGGDPLCTSASGEPCDATIPGSVIAQQPSVQIVKSVASGSASSAKFDFELSGLSSGNDTITVNGVSSAAGTVGITGTIGNAASITETSPADWPANPVTAICIDSNTNVSGNPTGPIGILTRNSLSIPVENMLNGAILTCTFTNSYSYSVTGQVFKDNGMGAGTANDGIRNGGEAGIPGVSLQLSNCGGTSLATATTNGAGNYSLTVPYGTARDTPLCVEETTPSVHLSTGASIDTTPLPSGTAVNAGGTSYTYRRTGTSEQIAFTWNGTGHYKLNFGDISLNTFAVSGAKTGIADSTVVYPHSFVAQTGGTVNFSITSSTAAPPISSWSGKIFADVGCTGTLQAGAALLYPPSTPTTVTAGQTVCIIMQEFIPGNALSAYMNTDIIQASFNFSNTTPALTENYTLTDITTVSSSALDLKKEVRNVSQSGAFGVNNRAKPSETLEYRITYTNNGPSPITGLSINDVTPAFTSFVSGVAGSTPATITDCRKNTPANPTPAAPVPCATVQAVGGAGPLNFQLTGPINPGASGAVLFQVKID